MHGLVVDMMGKIYGMMTVIGDAGSNKRRLRQWLCRCECGNEKVVLGSGLRSGTTTSCGCKRYKDLSVRNYKHGKVNSREWYSWSHIEDRCTNPKNPNYPKYGGRGIKLCERWTGNFANFYEDMGPRPPGTSLDRIDNDGNYEPGNCRWATNTQQSRNRRNNVFVEHGGKMVTIGELAEITGEDYHHLYHKHRGRKLLDQKIARKKLVT